MESTPLHKCGLGEQVAQARLFASLTIDDLAKHTRISEKYLTALEREDWPNLPADVFLRGYVRILAKTLQANQEEWTKLLPKQNENCEGGSTIVSEKPTAIWTTLLKSKALLWSGLFFLIVGVVLFISNTGRLTDTTLPPEPIHTEANPLTSPPSPLVETVVKHGQSFAPLDSIETTPHPTTAIYNVATKDVKLAISSPTLVWIKVDQEEWIQKTVSPGLYEIVFERQVLVKLSDVQKAKLILAGNPARSLVREYKISLKPQDSGVKL